MQVVFALLSSSCSTGSAGVLSPGCLDVHEFFSSESSIQLSSLAVVKITCTRDSCGTQEGFDEVVTLHVATTACQQAMAEQMASAEDLAAGLSHQNSMAHRALAAAKEAGVAAESRAVSAEAVAATLQRRLVRARQGGLKALVAATQCQSTEATV